MGVLRQKCVPTYESLLNNSNFSTSSFNMSYESYTLEIKNESMLIDEDLYKYKSDEFL
jgi:hypothetical protein